MPTLDTKTTKTPLFDDFAYIQSNDTLSDGRVALSGITVIPETTRTINFTSSQTATQIQADIDEVGKYIPIGVNITFQFGNGTYSLDNQINFKGFYGGGAVLIYGNTTETNATVLHTTQDVILDFKGNAVDGIDVALCSIVVYIFNLRIEVDDTHEPASFTNCTAYNRVWYSYLLVNGTSSNGFGVIAQQGTILDTRNNYFTGGTSGVYISNNSIGYSNGNDDTGTQPTYGIRANASVLYKSNTQPAGSTANENTVNGGEIR